MSGIVAAHGPLAPGTGERMLERLAHRGPDGAGSKALNGAWLGSRYLSIVDPVTGDQPIVGGAERDLWLVGDGMIHNHRDVREQLGAERFRTQSDLEAPIVLLDELGTGSFGRLWGPFALVVASDDGRFAAVRDVLGLAPLYWAKDGETTLFASEIKAFDDNLRPAVEPFPPGHCWTPERGLEAIRRFPGTTAVLLQSRAVESRPPAWVFDGLRESLIRAVDRSLEGNLTPGVLLSGGVDSSIITAIAAKRLRERGEVLKTFAVGLPDSGDLAAARTVAECWETDHHELVFTVEEAIDVVPSVIAGLESFDPKLVHSAVPNFFVSRLAAEHVKIILVGEGADELFAGYSHYGDFEVGAELHSELVDTLRGLHISGLQRVDRVGGANGIEPRLPFLDLDLVELAMALPPEWKLVTEQRQAKWLLRSAFDDWLPDEVLWRRKEQFGEGTGMNDVLGEHFGATVTEEELRAEAGVIDPPLRTREELAYYRLLVEALPGVNAEATVGRSPLT